MKYLDPNVNKALDKELIQEEEMFDKSGNLVLSQNKIVYAKKITTDTSEMFFIKTHDNTPFDTSGMFAHREKHIETKFKRVSKQTFDFYMLFLKTSNSLYLTRAQRSFLND